MTNGNAWQYLQKRIKIERGREEREKREREEYGSLEHGLMISLRAGHYAMLRTSLRIRVT